MSVDFKRIFTRIAVRPFKNDKTGLINQNIVIKKTPDMKLTNIETFIFN